MTEVVADGFQCTVDKGRTTSRGKIVNKCLCDAELETGTCKSGKRLENPY